MVFSVAFCRLPGRVKIAFCEQREERQYTATSWAGNNNNAHMLQVYCSSLVGCFVVTTSTTPKHTGSFFAPILFIEGS